MALVSWLAGGGNWSTPGKWNSNSVPGASDDVLIAAAGSYTVSITAPITAVSSINLSNTSAALSLDHITTGLTSGNFTNAGFLNIDTGNPGGAVTIGGTLINSGNVNIGYQYYNGQAAVTATMTAAGLSNTGTINLYGNGSYEPAVEKAVLNITGAAPTTLVGNYLLFDHALLEFASGSINTIASGAWLKLGSSQSLVANSSNTASNGALTGLALNGGLLDFSSTSLTTNTGFVNAGTWNARVSDAASNIMLGGTLTNYNYMLVQGYELQQGSPFNATVNATGLNNLGSIFLQGSGNGRGTLNITAAAPTTWTGTVILSGDQYGGTNVGKSLLEFASGSIANIAVGAKIGLFAPQAFVADAGNLNANGALVGLVNNAGSLDLRSGASVTTSAGLISTGILNVDDPHYGGSSLTIGGVLTNFGTAKFGATDSPAPTAVSATGLVNVSTINLYGSSSTNGATFSVNGNASDYGNININNNSRINVTGSYSQSAGFTTVAGPLTAGSATMAGGEINVAGTLTATGGVTLSGGDIEGIGTIVGNVNQTGGLIFGGTAADYYNYRFGFYNPTSPGTLTINGNFSETGGSVIEFLRGTAANPRFNTVNVTGSVNLSGGALQVDDILGDSGGLPLAAGQTFTVMTFAPGMLTGTFGSIHDGSFIGVGNNVNIGGGLTLQVVYDNAGGKIQLLVVNTPATGDHWTATSDGNWNTAGNWGAGVPGSSTNAIIDASGNYDVTINTPVSVGSIAVVNAPSTGGSLSIVDPWNNNSTAPTYQPMNVSVGGSLTNGGTMSVDYTGPYSTPGGTVLSIGGTLANGGSLTIGNGATSSPGVTVASTTVSAAALINTGSILLLGSPDKQTTLNIAGAAGFGTTGVLTGNVNIYGNDAATGHVLLEFGSGQITSIAHGSSLGLRGSQAFLADAGQTNSNSALAGLSMLAGNFQMVDSVSVTTTGGLTNAAELDVDYAGPYAVIGGSTLSIGGVLTNVGTVNVGNGGTTQSSNMTTTGLSNTGTINLQGTSPSASATLHVAGAAGFGVAGTLTGTVWVLGPSLLEFDTGQITTIASGATLFLNSATSFVANASNINGNSALVGLSSNGGEFKLIGGASVATAGNFLNAGRIDIDTDPGNSVFGGSLLAISGTLTSTNLINIGSGGETAATSVVMSGLVNTSTINLAGGATAHSTTIVNGAATNSGTITANDNSNLLIQGNLANYASVKALGGFIDIAGTVSGTGSFTIGNGGTIEFGGGVSNLIAFNPASTGVLELALPFSFTGTLHNFASGDDLRLDGVTAVSAVVNGLTMTIQTTGGQLNYALDTVTANGLTISVHNNISDISYATTSNYAGPRAEYSIITTLDASGNLASQLIDNGGSGDGVHTLTSYLQAHFSDGNVPLPQLQQIANVTHIVGGSDNDIINGNAAANALDGGVGNDAIDGKGGADTMTGGVGNDIYYVDNAGDAVTENANEGNDVVFASVSYTLSANVETLILQGSADLQGYGNGAANTLIGNTGNNLLDGGAGTDTMFGSAGNDVYFVDNMGDGVAENANEGNDSVFASVTFTLFANVENLILQGSADLQGYGNGLANTIYGNSGNNLLNGGAGVDLMAGGLGDDVYFADDPSDACFEVANQGNDSVFASTSYGLAADVEGLILQGSGNFQAYGNSQANTIYGNSGNNLINGGGGIDLMAGGMGDDVYYVDDPSDACFEVAGQGNDAVFATCSYGLAADVETLILQGSADLQAYGSAQANTIYGNAGNNLINGGAGADFMAGSAGGDVYYADVTSDVAFENANEGNDTVFATANFTLGANVENLILQGAADLQGFGNGQANVMVGNTGNNILNGFGGADQLSGGAGNDTFVFNVGQGAGDAVVDFAGNGAATGDALQFVGYGGGATFTNINATQWQVNYNGGNSHDIITFMNGAPIDPTDLSFI